MPDKINNKKPAKDASIADSLTGSNPIANAFAATNELIQTSKLMREQEGIQPESPFGTMATPQALVQNAVKGVSEDNLLVGNMENQRLKELRDLQKLRDAALGSPKGILAEILGIAGLGFSVAGLNNFSPTLNMLGMRLGQEAGALKRQLLDPIDKMEALKLEKWSEEIKQGDIERFDVMIMQEFIKEGENLLKTKEPNEGLLESEITEILRKARVNKLPERAISALDSTLRGLKNIMTTEEEVEFLSGKKMRRSVIQEATDSAYDQFFNTESIKELERRGDTNEIYDRFVEWLDGFSTGGEKFPLTSEGKKQILDKFWKNVNGRWILRSDTEAFPTPAIERIDETTMAVLNVLDLNDAALKEEVTGLKRLGDIYPLFRGFKSTMSGSEAINSLIAKLKEEAVWSKNETGEMELMVPYRYKGGKGKEIRVPGIMGGRAAALRAEETMIPLFAQTVPKIFANDAQKEIMWKDFVESGGDNLSPAAKRMMQEFIAAMFGLQGVAE